MKFEIVTLFPEYFVQPLKQSLIGRALKEQLFDIEIIYLRDFATDKHRTVDDTPFGGGGGMVLKLEPLDRCLQSLGIPRRDSGKTDPDHRVLLTSAAGRPFTQERAVSLSLSRRITLICGHYLGVDERLLDLYDIDEISIGDYVLTGGEPAALVLVDAISRLIPKVLGNFESALEDSHMELPIGPPVYTRPADYEGLRVPDALLSGDHEAIRKFRRRESLRECARRRPELLKAIEMNPEERAWLNDDRRHNDTNE